MTCGILPVAGLTWSQRSLLASRPPVQMRAGAEAALTPGRERVLSSCINKDLTDDSHSPRAGLSCEQPAWEPWPSIEIAGAEWKELGESRQAAGGSREAWPVCVSHVEDSLHSPAGSHTPGSALALFHISQESWAHSRQGPVTKAAPRLVWGLFHRRDTQSRLVGHGLSPCSFGQEKALGCGVWIERAPGHSLQV